MRLVQNGKRWKIKLILAFISAGTFAHGALTFTDGLLFAQAEQGGGGVPPPVPAPEAGPDVELPPPEDRIPPPSAPVTPAPGMNSLPPEDEMEEPPVEPAVPMDSSNAPSGSSAPRRPSIGEPKAPATNRSGGSQSKTSSTSKAASKDKAKNAERISEDKVGADLVPDGQELVNIDFPEPTEIKDIIRAVSLWTGKNVILGRDVAGKVQMISPRKVTKVEAYQAFLSALNLLGLTTVETGKVIKIVPVRSAVKSNLKTFLGSSWTPMTDEFITQIVPLKYINAREIQTTLSRIVSSNSMIAYQPTNTLIISDSGFKVRRILDIIELLDVQTQQPKVSIVPIKFGDAKAISTMVQDIFKAQAGANKGAASYLTYKIMTDERTNSVIIFGPPRTIADVKELVRKFDVRQDDPSRQSTIYVRPLDYADAKKLAATLSSLAQGGKTGASRRPPIMHQGPPGVPGGAVADSTPDVAVLDNDVKITADESSNSLLITGSRAAYDALNMIVRKLDTRKSQVFVEAEILDINVENGFRFGTSIFAGAKSGSANSAITWESKSLSPLVVAQTSEATDQATKAKAVEPFAEDFNVGILSGSQVDIPGLGKFSPGALIKMIKTDANTKVLSSPHILTSNNETAKIAVGDKLFFRAGTEVSTSGTAVQNVKDIDVDLALELKPNISHSNYVTMKIDLDASSGKIGDNALPSVTKRKTSQIVTVKNGQTVVISGLVKLDEYEVYKKIPLLGDIPIIGWLFRNSDIKKTKQSLAIFLTPYIVHGANDLAAIYGKKIEERDELLGKMYGSSFKEDEFYQRLPTREDGAYKADAYDVIDEKRKDEQNRELMRDLGYERQDVKSIQGVKKDEASSDTPTPDVAPDTIPEKNSDSEERSDFLDDDNASNKKSSSSTESGIQIEVEKPEQG